MHLVLESKNLLSLHLHLLHLQEDSQRHHVVSLHHHLVLHQRIHLLLPNDTTLSPQIRFKYHYLKVTLILNAIQL